MSTYLPKLTCPHCDHTEKVSAEEIAHYIGQQFHNNPLEVFCEHCDKLFFPHLVISFDKLVR